MNNQVCISQCWIFLSKALGIKYVDLHLEIIKTFDAKNIAHIAFLLAAVKTRVVAVTVTYIAVTVNIADTIARTGYTVTWSCLSLCKQLCISR